MSTYYTVYWGKSGGTLTISGKSVSGASNAYTAAQQQALETMTPPWRRADSNYGADITAIRFVNNPKCGDSGFKSFYPLSYGSGTRPWFSDLSNLKSVSGGVDASAVTETFLYGFGNNRNLESLSLEGWSIKNAKDIIGLINGGSFIDSSLKTISFKNVNFANLSSVTTKTLFASHNLTSVNRKGRQP